MNKIGYEQRRMEMKLLIPAAAYLAAGAMAIYLWVLKEPRIIFAGAVVPALAFMLVSLIWQFRGFRGDPFLLPVTALLSYTSLIFLYRLQSAYAYRQFVWLMVGLLMLLLTTRLLTNYRVLAEYKYLIAASGVVILLLPIFFGVEMGGAKSWLDFKLFSLQPSEFVKILVVIFLASFMAENRLALTRGSGTVLGMSLPGPQVWGPLLGMWGIALLLLVFQRDLGTALIYFSTSLAMIYIATARLAYVGFGTAFFLAGAWVAGKMFQHVAARFTIWLDPWSYITGKGYQIAQSLFAISAGGVTGAGLGDGYPKFIPAVHTDFIFSAITEELGLMGGMGIILLYLFFIYRGFRIAISARDDFSALLAGGLTALMGLQSFIIIAGVIKMLPLTGVTLPFVSYGGSSLVANFIILGMLMNISNEAFANEK